jgi:WD40 repeat protein
MAWRRRIVSGSDDTTLRVWDADSGQCLAVLKGHGGPVTGCGWFPADTAAAAEKPLQIQLPDELEGESDPAAEHPVLQPQPATEAESGGSETEILLQIVSCSRDATLRYWSAQTYSQTASKVGLGESIGLLVRGHETVALQQGGVKML